MVAASNSSDDEVMLGSRFIFAASVHLVLAVFLARLGYVTGILWAGKTGWRRTLSLAAEIVMWGLFAAWILWAILHPPFEMRSMAVPLFFGNAIIGYFTLVLGKFVGDEIVRDSEGEAAPVAGDAGSANEG